MSGYRSVSLQTRDICQWVFLARSQELYAGIASFKPQTVLGKKDILECGERQKESVEACTHGMEAFHCLAMRTTQARYSHA